MGESRDVYVGIDFDDEYVQVSFVRDCSLEEGLRLRRERRGTSEAENWQLLQPESLCLHLDKSRYRIPIALFVQNASGECLYGEKAYANREAEGYVCDLVRKLKEADCVKLQGREYTAVQLFGMFMNKLYADIEKKYGENTIKKLCITTPEKDEELWERLAQSIAFLKLPSSRIMFMPHIQSLMYYAVSQHKDLRTNDAAVFHYDRCGLVFYRLSFGRTEEPYTVTLDKEDLSASFPYSRIMGDDGLEGDFEAVSERLLNRQNVTAVYVTGSGFEKAWADRVLRAWCVARRVFLGQNLYCKGACYAARIESEGQSSNYRLLHDELLYYSICLQTAPGITSGELVMADVGDRWQDVSSNAVILLDNTEELCFEVRPLLKREPICVIMTLDGIPLRENKSIRLSVNLRFQNRHIAIVTVRDIGFGVFYEKNYRIWEQSFEIN